MNAPGDFRSGFVTLAGRPNAGKSSLVNRLMGEKVVIVSPRPQTTRNVIRCILTTPEMQAVLLDTPGVHDPCDALGESMMESLREGFKGSDLFLYLVEPGKPMTETDMAVLSAMRSKGVPICLVRTKSDLVTEGPPAGGKSAPLTWPAMPSGKDFGPGSRADGPRTGSGGEAPVFIADIEVSTRTGKGIDTLLKLFATQLPPGPMYFPADQLMDCDERFMVREFIREAVMNLTRDEVPHVAGVTVVDMIDRSENLSVIDAEIVVETESQKKIIIGANGSMLKRIGTFARKEIESALGRRIHLDLWIKVRKKWRNNKLLLREIVFR